MLLADTWLRLECEMSSTDLSVWTLVLRGQDVLEGCGTFQWQILARGSGPLGLGVRFYNPAPLPSQSLHSDQK